MSTQKQYTLTSEDATKLSEIINVPREEILHGPEYMTKYKLTMPTLKSIIKYLNQVMYAGIKFSGIKSDLVGRIVDAIYTKTLLRDNNPPIIPQPRITVKPIMAPQVLERPAPIPVPLVPKVIKSLIGRVLSPEELKLYTLLESDPTNMNRQDPMYKITHVLDVLTLTPSYSSPCVASGRVDPSIYTNRKVFVHIYKKTTYDHAEWALETRVDFNGTSLTVPKKGGSFLLAAHPIQVPIYLLKDTVQLSITIPSWSGPTDALAALVLIEDVPVENRVDSRPKEIEIEPLKGSPVVGCLTAFKESFNEGNLEKSMSIAEAILRGDNDRPVGENSNDEMVISAEEVVSLKDPLSLAKIDLPARSKNCRHKGCFDLKTFLCFAHDSREWNCPLCSVRTPYDTIYVDFQMSQILTKAKEDKVKIALDGSWIDMIPSKPVKDEKQTKTTAKSLINDLTVDGPFGPEVIEID